MPKALFRFFTSVLLPLPGVFSADAPGWGVPSFVGGFGCFPGPFELGNVISKDISGPEGGDEVVELALLSVGEGSVAGGVSVGVAVALDGVALAEGLAH